MGEPIEVETQVTMKFDFATKPLSPEELKWALAYPGTGNMMGEIPVHQISPLYPEQAKQKGKQGKVVIGAMASQDGTLSNLKVLEGNSLFNDAALEAVKQDKQKFYAQGAPNIHVTIIVKFVP